MNEVLREAMIKAGHTSESLALLAGVDAKSTQRWVSRNRIPRPRARVAAAAALGRDVEELWPGVTKRRDASWFRPWQEIERDAVALRSFESMVVPGLLQTEAYARAVLSGAGLGSRADVERQLAGRMRRQEILTREKPVHLTAVIDETALRRPIGGREVMRDQLAALVTAAGQPEIRVHVVPRDAGAYAGLNGPFVLANDEDHRIVGYLDNQLQGQLNDAAADLAALAAAWESVRGEALPHRQSIELMKDVAASWT